MPSNPPFRRTRHLFSATHLDEQVPQSDSRGRGHEDELRTARDELAALWERERGNVESYSRSGLEAAFVRSVFETLGVTVPTETPEDRGRSVARPDYGFVEVGDGAGEAQIRAERDTASEDDVVAVATVERWDRPLEGRGPGDGDGDFATPCYWMHRHLQETPARWGVLTNGRRWRLYHSGCSHRLDAYYEIDLPALLESGDLSDFQFFYRLFRGEAFVQGADGQCALDDLYDGSVEHTSRTCADLRENAADALEALAAGFLRHPDNDLTAGDLEAVYDGSLAYLYRLLVGLYAERDARSRPEPTTGAEAESASLHALARAVTAESERPTPAASDGGTALWSRLADQFARLDRGGRSQHADGEALALPPFPGDLFRSDADADRPVRRFLADNAVGDAYLERVLDLLLWRRSGGERSPVDYASLRVRHLGSIYERLLEYELDVVSDPASDQRRSHDGGPIDGDPPAANGPSGGNRAADVGDTEGLRSAECGASDTASGDEGSPAPAVDVRLTAGSDERKSTGSYYTPEYVVRYVVENALSPLVDDVRERFGDGANSDDVSPEAFERALLDLDVLDPAMGTGRFLSAVVDALVREILGSQEAHAASRRADSTDPSAERLDSDRTVASVRRQVAERCPCGVDQDWLAVELARTSLWLGARCGDVPPRNLRDRLKTGNSLVGCVVEDCPGRSDISPPGRSGPEERDVGSHSGEPSSAAVDRVERHQRLIATANVRTAMRFGLDDVPPDADERMAEALDDDAEWAAVERTPWFRNAQRWAADDGYFHWALEFPAVFADSRGGTRKRGFDAVVGNPPWAITTDDRLKRYLWETYEYQSDKPDLYRFFVERCLALTGGTCSMVTPHSWLVMGSAASLREHVVENRHLSQASLVPGNAFEGVGANMITFLLDVRERRDAFDVWDLRETGAATRVRTIDYADIDTETYKLELRIGREARRVAAAMERGAARLEDVADVTTGYQLYHTSVHPPDVIEAERYHSDRRESDAHVPEIRGGSLSKYVVDPAPDGYVDGTAEFYRRPAARFTTGPKVLVREVTGADGIVAAHTDRELLFPKSILSVVPTSEPFGAAYLSGLLNSDALACYLLVTGEKSSQNLFPRASISSLRRLPVPAGSTPVSGNTVSSVLDGCDVDRETREALSELVAGADTAADMVATLADRIGAAKRERRGLSTDLGAYLDGDAPGAPLGEHPAYRSATGVEDTILGRTGATHPNLKLAAVEVTRRPDALEVDAVARYKPTDDASATDGWGYARTDPIPAAEFVGLEGVERELVADYVAYVVNEADDGTAGFRSGATKTNSLVDRLEALELPDLSAVRDDFERYRSEVRRARRIAARIDCETTLLNELVCDLYGLSPEDRAVVRATLDD